MGYIIYHTLNQYYKHSPGPTKIKIFAIEKSPPHKPLLQNSFTATTGIPIWPILVVMAQYKPFI